MLSLICENENFLSVSQRLTRLMMQTPNYFRRLSYFKQPSFIEGALNYTLFDILTQTKLNNYYRNRNLTLLRNQKSVVLFSACDLKL